MSIRTSSEELVRTLLLEQRVANAMAMLAPTAQKEVLRWVSEEVSVHDEEELGKALRLITALGRHCGLAGRVVLAATPLVIALTDEVNGSVGAPTMVPGTVTKEMVRSWRVSFVEALELILVLLARGRFFLGSEDEKSLSESASEWSRKRRAREIEQIWEGFVSDVDASQWHQMIEVWVATARVWLETEEVNHRLPNSCHQTEEIQSCSRVQARVVSTIRTILESPRLQKDCSASSFSCPNSSEILECLRNLPRQIRADLDYAVRRWLVRELQQKHQAYNTANQKIKSLALVKSILRTISSDKDNRSMEDHRSWTLILRELLATMPSEILADALCLVSFEIRHDPRVFDALIEWFDELQFFSSPPPGLETLHVTKFCVADVAFLLTVMEDRFRVSRSIYEKQVHPALLKCLSLERDAYVLPDVPGGSNSAVPSPTERILKQIVSLPGMESRSAVLIELAVRWMEPGRSSNRMKRFAAVQAILVSVFQHHEASRDPILRIVFGAMASHSETRVTKELALDTLARLVSSSAMSMVAVAFKIDEWLDYVPLMEPTIAVRILEVLAILARKSRHFSDILILRLRKLSMSRSDTDKGLGCAGLCALLNLNVPNDIQCTAIETLCGVSGKKELRSQTEIFRGMERLFLGMNSAERNSIASMESFRPLKVCLEEALNGIRESLSAHFSDVKTAWSVSGRDFNVFVYGMWTIAVIRLCFIMQWLDVSISSGLTLLIDQVCDIEKVTAAVFSGAREDVLAKQRVVIPLMETILDCISREDTDVPTSKRVLRAFSVLSLKSTADWSRLRAHSLDAKEFSAKTYRDQHDRLAGHGVVDDSPILQCQWSMQSILKAWDLVCSHEDHNEANRMMLLNPIMSCVSDHLSDQTKLGNEWRLTEEECERSAKLSLATLVQVMEWTSFSGKQTASSRRRTRRKTSDWSDSPVSPAALRTHALSILSRVTRRNCEIFFDQKQEIWKLFFKAFHSPTLRFAEILHREFMNDEGSTPTAVQSLASLIQRTLEWERKSYPNSNFDGIRSTLRHILIGIAKEHVMNNPNVVGGLLSLTLDSMSTDRAQKFCLELIRTVIHHHSNDDDMIQSGRVDEFDEEDIRFGLLMDQNSDSTLDGAIVVDQDNESEWKLCIESFTATLPAGDAALKTCMNFVHQSIREELSEPAEAPSLLFEAADVFSMLPDPADPAEAPSRMFRGSVMEFADSLVAAGKRICSIATTTTDSCKLERLLEILIKVLQSLGRHPMFTERFACWDCFSGFIFPGEVSNPDSLTLSGSRTLEIGIRRRQMGYSELQSVSWILLKSLGASKKIRRPSFTRLQEELMKCLGVTSSVEGMESFGEDTSSLPQKRSRQNSNLQSRNRFINDHLSTEVQRGALVDNFADLEDFISDETDELDAIDGSHGADNDSLSEDDSKEEI